jgi:hypothetical protein
VVLRLYFIPAEFKWDDVKVDKHRENYLGHSVKAPVGRWQKGKISPCLFIYLLSYFLHAESSGCDIELLISCCYSVIWSNIVLCCCIYCSALLSGNVECFSLLPAHWLCMCYLGN